LEFLFPHIKRGGIKEIRLLERDKQIIRLKKGLYVCNPKIIGKILSTELAVNHLYAPSYVSERDAFMVRQKEELASTNINQVKRDVLPFVKNLKELDIWTNDYFVQLVDMMRFE